MPEWIERLRERFTGDNSIRIIVMLGAAGIALILISGLLPKKNDVEEKLESVPITEAVSDPDIYRIQLEERLTALLSQMEGVGKVTVMVTLGGSSEHIFAEEVKVSRNQNGALSESAPVLTRSGNAESALIAETKYPAVCGTAILCSGGSHAAVRERITQAAAALLGIPAANIYVGKASGTVN
ncbi:MAG: hypothetical protein MJ065_06585 [Oscillospiraceae bacterium]|nr:hypothetical protein [Oscillospiraceae bacterium]